MPDVSAMRDHSACRAEIEKWRGECLNYFARAEQAVGTALEAAVVAGKVEKLRHLAGQRLQDLITTAEQLGGTKKQKDAFSDARDRWQEIEGRRQFLAHGVMTETLDRNDKWVALFDIRTYRSNEPTALRWAVTECEADQFSTELEDGFKRLSTQLGSFKKRL